MTTMDAPPAASSLEASPGQAALALLARHGVARRRAAGTAHSSPRAEPSEDATATALMELFRVTGSTEAFEMLVQLTGEQLLRRVRARTRFLGERVDPHELLQDAFVNMFRYPDRFDDSRPGAFRAWSSTIVDNAVRRHLRRSRTGPDVCLRPVEILAQQPARTMEPGMHAMQTEACEQASVAFRLFLGMYLAAYHTLSERERFVLQMVEVRGLRYAQLAKMLSIRPEALKMVVFRARRRIFERVTAMLASEVGDDNGHAAGAVGRGGAVAL